MTKRTAPSTLDLSSLQVAAAEALRQRSRIGHDVVVRARLDVPFTALLPLGQFARALVRQPTRVWAAGGVTGTIGQVGMPPQRIMHDWLYIAGPVGIAALASMTAAGVVHSHRARCFGFCPEEQVEIQLCVPV